MRDRTGWAADPEPGTVAWIVTKRDQLRRALADERFNVELGRALYQQIEESDAWKLLRNIQGKPFRSFDQFCADANGVGMARGRIEERLSAAERAQALAGSDGVVALAKHGRPTKQEADGKGANSTISRGQTHAAYIVARLKRDAPQIAERLARGEFRSAREAAIEAGIIKPSPPLTELRRAWKRATTSERKAFLQEVSE
jgi:hypothetical protein